jgi:WD40 repeat protein
MTQADQDDSHPMTNIILAICTLVMTVGILWWGQLDPVKEERFVESEYHPPGTLPPNAVIAVAPTPQTVAPTEAAPAPPPLTLVGTAISFETIKTVSFAPRLFYSAAISPDERWIAGGTSDWTRPGEVLLWDATTKEVKFRRGFDLGVRSLAYSPDSKLLAVGAFSSDLMIIDLTRMEIVTQWRAHSASINGMSFSPDGKILATASLDHLVKLWDVVPSADPKIGWPLRATLVGHADWAFSVAFAPDGKMLYSGGRVKDLYVWDVEKKLRVMDWKGIPSLVETLAVAPDNQQLAVGLWNGTIEFRKPGDGTVTSKLVHMQDDQYGVLVVAYSKNGKRLYSGAVDGTVKVWDVAAGKLLSTIDAHAGKVWAVNPTADGKRLLTTGTDGTVRMWELETNKELFQLSDETRFSDTASRITAKAWSPDGALIATAHTNGAVHVRLAKDGTTIKKGKSSVELKALAFVPNNGRLVGAAADQTLLDWDYVKNSFPMFPRMISHPKILQGATGTLTCLAVTADGRSLFTGTAEGKIDHWDVASGTVLQSLDFGIKSVLCLACSADGRWLVAGGQDATVPIWDLSQLTAKPVAKLNGPLTEVRHLVFARGKPLLAASGADSRIVLWDLAEPIPVSSGPVPTRLVQPTIASGPKPRELISQSTSVNCLTLSSEGDILAAGSADKTVQTWETRTGKPGAKLKGTAAILSLFFTPGGISSIENDNTLGIWSSRKVVAFPETAGRYIKLRSLSSERPGDPLCSAAEITVFEDSLPVPKNQWKLISTDSDDTGNEGHLAFDDDPKTLWHTDWHAKDLAPHPHEIIIDLGQARRLSALTVLTRDDNNINGNIKDFEFFVSQDPNQFGSPVLKGQFALPPRPGAKP